MDLTDFPWWDAVMNEAGPPPEVWQEGSRVVVALRGEHDMSTAASLAEALAEVNAVGEGDVVVDLSEVLFMDAAIITELIDGRNALRSRSRDLTLRAPARFPRRVLELCGLAGLVDPVSAVAAGEIGSCVTVRGTWSSHTPRRGRMVQSPSRTTYALATPAPADDPIARIV
jgi:anti-anti-sigma factor